MYTRPEDRHRRAAEPHSLAVPDGSGGADQSGRYSGRGLRYRPCLYAQLHHGNAGRHQCGRLRRRRGVLHDHRRGVWPDACCEGVEAEPHRGVEERIKRLAEVRGTLKRLYFYPPLLRQERWGFVIPRRAAADRNPTTV